MEAVGEEVAVEAEEGEVVVVATMGAGMADTQPDNMAGVKL